MGRKRVEGHQAKRCLICGKGIYRHSTCSSLECKNELAIRRFIERTKAPSYNIRPSLKSFKLWFEKYRGPFQCEECGIYLENKYDNSCILEIHHEDGNSKNSELNNIKLLCPNCHAMTPNYRSLNFKPRIDRKKTGKRR
jgi:5-methylcytosine-specific restriction endonuclease McrA